MEGLLRRSDVGAFAPASFRARLVIGNPADGKTHALEIWRSGSDKTLVRFLDAKERGKDLLRIDDQVWLLTLDAKKPVHLSPAYRLYGGATLDAILGTRLAGAYRVERVKKERQAGRDTVVFELRAKREGLLFWQVHYVVAERTERAITAIYRLRSGRKATAVDFLEWNERPIYGRRLIVRDLLRNGAQANITVSELQERPIPDGLFSLDDGTARHALDNMAIPPSRELPGSRCWSGFEPRRPLMQCRKLRRSRVFESRTTDVAVLGWPIQFLTRDDGAHRRCRWFGLSSSPT